MSREQHAVMAIRQMMQPTYEAWVAAEARACADELDVLRFGAEVRGADEIEIPADLALRLAAVLERLAELRPFDDESDR